MSELTWISEMATLGSIELWERNPKRMPKARAERLLKSWREKGQYQTIAVGPNGECYDGHQRVNVLRAAGYPDTYELAVRRSDRALTERERESIVIESSVGTIGALDFDELAGWDYEALREDGLDTMTLGVWNDQAANLALMLTSEVPDFQPVDENEQPRLDQKAPVTCPECGCEFVPK